MLSDYYNNTVKNVSLFDVTSWASSDSILDLTIPRYSQYMIGCLNKGYNNLKRNLTEDGTNMCLKKEFFKAFDNQTLLCCSNIAQSLIQENYETFFDIVKHSQTENTTQTLEERSDFFQKYVNKSSFLRQFNTTMSPFLLNQTGIIPFCETVSKLKLHGISLKSPFVCTLFRPVITSKGFCYNFNSLPMNEIFRPDAIPWASVLNAKDQTSQLVNPSGYGPNNGLNFVLNSFESFSASRSTKNFILSITNENNPFNIFKQNYIVEPGNAYTYRVIANQIVSTDRFNLMDPSKRNCSLPNEIGSLV
jgi:hypothetical protein